MNVGALVMGTGWFLGILYHNHNEEPQKSIGN